LSAKELIGEEYAVGQKEAFYDAVVLSQKASFLAISIENFQRILHENP
jgi:hypothetical protein